jgi:hypothetical protein
MVQKSCGWCLQGASAHLPGVLMQGASCADLQAKKITGIPCMCLQLLLPESKQHLHQLLSLYSKQGLLPAQPAHDRTGVLQEAGQTADCHHDAAATIITKPLPRDDPACCAASKADAAVLGDAGQPAQVVAGGDSATAAAAAASSAGPQWWQRFSRQVTCICITELRFGLLAQSCMGCRGAIALISNLVRWVTQPGVICNKLSLYKLARQPLCHTRGLPPCLCCGLQSQPINMWLQMHAAAAACRMHAACIILQATQDTSTQHTCLESADPARNACTICCVCLYMCPAACMCPLLV